MLMVSDLFHVKTMPSQVIMQIRKTSSCALSLLLSNNWKSLWKQQQLFLINMPKLSVDAETFERRISHQLGYLKDSNAAAHSVDTGIS